MLIEENVAMGNMGTLTDMEMILSIIKYEYATNNKCRCISISK